MLIARKVALRVNGVRAIDAQVRPDPKRPQLVITDPWLEEFAVDESFTLELLELVHPHEIQRRLPDGGWRKVSLRVLIALLRSGMIRVVEQNST